MGVIDRFRDNFRKWLYPDEFTDEIREHEEYIQTRRDYRRGYQRPQIKVKAGQVDDNVYANFIGLILDRAVSMLIGQGVEFDLPGDEETPEDKWLTACWDANKKSITLHRAALAAAEAGTGYIKLLPNAVYGQIEGRELVFPRLVVIDPKWVMLDSNPEDFEQVIRYNIRYVNTGVDGKEQGRKQIIENVGEGWTIEDFVANQNMAGKWQSMGVTPWEPDFAPIIHWQNLPTIDSAYGAPDITDDVIIEQDKLNYIASNICKIIRYHAHPKTYTINLGKPDKESWGPDQLLQFSGTDDSQVANLEMESDLVSSINFFTLLRQALFDVTRTVDIDSIQDKVGALTNFGLKVLYQDSLAKIHTKRELFGDMLIELNRRMMVMGGLKPELCECIWPEVLPVNEVETQQLVKADMELGLLSKQHAAQIRGYDYTVEQERIAGEDTQTANIGELIMRNFERGNQ